MPLGRRAARDTRGARRNSQPSRSTARQIGGRGRTSCTGPWGRPHERLVGPALGNRSRCGSAAAADRLRGWCPGSRRRAARCRHRSAGSTLRRGRPCHRGNSLHWSVIRRTDRWPGRWSADMPAGATGLGAAQSRSGRRRRHPSAMRMSVPAGTGTCRDRRERGLIDESIPDPSAQPVEPTHAPPTQVIGAHELPHARSRSSRHQVSAVDRSALGHAVQSVHWSRRCCSSTSSGGAWRPAGAAVVQSDPGRRSGWIRAPGAVPVSTADHAGVVRLARRRRGDPQAPQLSQSDARSAQ
jgi:hypothetical protein